MGSCQSKDHVDEKHTVDSSDRNNDEDELINQDILVDHDAVDASEAFTVDQSTTGRSVRTHKTSRSNGSRKSSRTSRTNRTGGRSSRHATQLLNDTSSFRIHRGRKHFVLYSDYTCPYCYLEFIRLTQAMERLPKSMRMEIAHGCFQLDETLPSAGVDKYDFLSKIIPPASLDPMIDILCEQFEDLDMEMCRRGLLGNSAAAHRLQIWAEERCPPSQALKLKHELMAIHSCLGKSMGDIDAIVKAAKTAGLDDEEKIRTVLKDSSYATKLKKAKKHAKEALGIASVPCLVLVDAAGHHRKLDDATGIESVEGFADVIAKYI